MGKPRLNETQLEEMCQLRERGWGIDRIAEHFTKAGTPISANAINWQCMRLGADAPLRLRGRHSQPAAPYMRGNHIVRPYSPEEDALLRELDLQGLKHKHIAVRLGRRPNSVLGRLMTLARMDQRHEEAQAA